MKGCLLKILGFLTSLHPPMGKCMRTLLVSVLPKPKTQSESLMVGLTSVAVVEAPAAERIRTVVPLEARSVSSDCHMKTGACRSCDSP